ncbi:MAG: methyltransferase domain-containing protein [Anaerolineae bacterium]|nr:methyltransferase domain-containing protein [Anaerolineae bacterium]
MNLAGLKSWLRHRLLALRAGRRYAVFPEMVPALHCPEGYTRDSLLALLSGYVLEGTDGRIRQEFETYLRESFKRSVYTLNLIPPGQGSLLEIGSQPYFTSILIRKFTDYDLHCTNYFGGPRETRVDTMRNPSTGDEMRFEYINSNIEEEAPSSDKYDVVLCCEVIEHLTMDPMGALLRLKTTLKENGHLILTTPNVNRLENVAKMLAGVNIHDPYSGYGMYGRHNREYNKHELHLLLTHLGFEIEVMFSADVYPNRAQQYFSFNRYRRLVEFRSLDLGQYIFLRARNTSEARTCKPNWLYRNYVAGDLCPDC